MSEAKFRRSAATDPKAPAASTQLLKRILIAIVIAGAAYGAYRTVQQAKLAATVEQLQSDTPSPSHNP